MNGKQMRAGTKGQIRVKLNKVMKELEKINKLIDKLTEAKK